LPDEVNNHRKNGRVAWHVVLAPEARHLYRKPTSSNPPSPSGAAYFKLQTPFRLENIFSLITRLKIFSGTKPIFTPLAG
jgi:hypothetical protein